MKVIFVSCISVNLYLFRMGIMRYFKSIGYEEIAAASRDEYTEKIIKEGIKFQEVKINRKGLNPFFEFFSLYKFIKKEKPDLILSFTSKLVLYTSLLTYFLNIRVISVITGLGYVFINKNILTFIVKKLYRKLLKRNEWIIFQNKDDYKFFKKLKLIPQKKAIVIRGSGVNTEYYKPRGEKKKSSVNFLFIGRLLIDKGLCEFMESAKIIKEQYPETGFNILGFFDKGNPAAVSKKYISEMKNKKIINYLGDTKDVRKYIAKNDIVVLPSYREGVPRSLLEASSMEKPIITTDAPGCREVVDDKKNGIMVKVKDVKTLTDAFEWMIKNPKKRIIMGKNGRKKVLKEFDEKIVVKKYYDVILNVLNKNRRN